jgi:hypothetical protein
VGFHYRVRVLAQLFGWMQNVTTTNNDGLFAFPCLCKRPAKSVRNPFLRLEHRDKD